MDAGGGYELFRYDARNQLVSFTDGTTEATYGYRPDGLRHSKTVGGVKTAHVLDGANVIADVIGGVEAYYARGINILWDGKGAYYLFNAHGDVVAIAGAVIETAEYDAFGNVISGGFSSPFMYCGEYLDSESGMYYLRARYYNLATGRFFTEDTYWNPQNMIYGSDPMRWNEHPVNPNDPLGLNTYTYKPDIQDIVQSGNLYVFGMNNPVRLKDPSGNLDGVDDAIIIIAVGGAFFVALTVAPLADLNFQRAVNTAIATKWNPRGFYSSRGNYFDIYCRDI